MIDLQSLNLGPEPSPCNRAQFGPGEEWAAFAELDLILTEASDSIEFDMTINTCPGINSRKRKR